MIKSSLRVGFFYMSLSLSLFEGMRQINHLLCESVLKALLIILSTANSSLRVCDESSALRFEENAWALVGVWFYSFKQINC